MKKVLVTGAGGFIGFHFVKRLLDEGYFVIGIDNLNSYYDVNLKYARLAESGIYANQEDISNNKIYREYSLIDYGQLITSIQNTKYKFVRLDIEDKDGLSQLFETNNFDFVVNLAAQAGVRYSIENPDAYIRSNVVGFLNILELCRHNDVRHLVYASSSSVYGTNAKIPFEENDRTDTPVSLYAATKKSNELMAYTYSHLYGIQTTGLRFFTVYGPWGRPDMSPILFADAILRNKPINVFNNGNMERDFTYIDDIIEGVYRAMISLEEGVNRVMNIGNGSPINLLSFIETLENCLGVNAIKNMCPMQPGDVYKTWADTGIISKVCGFTPKTNIMTGVKEFVEWYKTFYSFQLVQE